MIALALDHLWQSTLFAAGAGLLTLAYRNNGAHIRYWMWFAASAKFLLPFSILMGVGKRLVDSVPMPVAASFDMATLEQVTQPFSGTIGPALSRVSPAQLDLTTGAIVLWGVGFVATLSYWLLRLWRIRAAMRAATPLWLTPPLPIPVKSTASRLEPGLVGIWRPTLFLPEGIVASLSPQELAAVLAHELCHLRRRDNLTAAFHMLVEAVFWFYPPVWWLGAQLMTERERACDEAVVRSGKDPQVYAEGILKVCRFYVQSRLVCASGVSGGHLKKRIEEIAANRMKVRMSVAKKVLLAAVTATSIALALLTASIASPHTTAQAQTSTDAAPSLEARLEARRQRTAEQRRPRTAVPFDPKQLDKYVGVYQLASNQFLRIVHSDGHFYGRLGQSDLEFFAESPTQFFVNTHPVQISFVTDARGNVTALVLHASGLEDQAPKVEESVVEAAETALAERVKSNTPSPGTEAMLRRYIAAFQNGRPNYDEMTPELALLVRSELEGYLELFQKWGALKSLTFSGVSESGMDKYLAVYERSSVDMYIAPLSPDGKMAGRGMGRVQPQ